MSNTVAIDIATPMRQWTDLLPDVEDLVRSAATAAWRASGDGTAADGLWWGSSTLTTAAPPHATAAAQYSAL